MAAVSPFNAVTAALAAIRACQMLESKPDRAAAQTAWLALRTSLQTAVNNFAPLVGPPCDDPAAVAVLTASAALLAAVEDPISGALVFKRDHREDVCGHIAELDAGVNNARAARAAVAAANDQAAAQGGAGANGLLISLADQDRAHAKTDVAWILALIGPVTDPVLGALVLGIIRCYARGSSGGGISPIKTRHMDLLLDFMRLRYAEGPLNVKMIAIAAWAEANPNQELRLLDVFAAVPNDALATNMRHAEVLHLREEAALLLTYYRALDLQRSKFSVDARDFVRAFFPIENASRAADDRSTATKATNSLKEGSIDYELLAKTCDGSTSHCCFHCGRAGHIQVSCPLSVAQRIAPSYVHEGPKVSRDTPAAAAHGQIGHTDKADRATRDTSTPTGAGKKRGKKR